MKPLKALLVEDSETDEELLLRQLAKANYDVQSIRVQTAADLKRALAEREWDIILSDYAMPGFSGLDALRILKESGRDIPLIIISGTIGEDVAVEAMRVGVDDYLIKGNLTRLAPAIERELENAASRQAQKQAEESLRRSEENLAAAQRIAHVGSWETNLANNRLFWSDEVYRIFGVSKDNFEGTLESFINLIHPEDRQSVQVAADAALAQITPYNIEHRIIRPNGEVRIVSEIGEVTFDESGSLIRFIGSVQDVTERRRAENALRESEMRMQTILETEPECVKVLGLKGELLEMNSAGLTMLEVDSIEQVRGAEVIKIVAPEHRRAFADLTKNVLAGGTQVLEFEIVGLKGTRRWLETHAVPMRSQAGEITSLLSVTRDITERKRVEAEKALLAAQIERQHKRLNNIVANVPGVVWEAFGKPDAATQRIDFVSEYVETMLGYTVEEWITTPNFWLSIVHPEDKERIALEAAERFHTGDGYTRQFRWITKDGRIVWVESQATVIRDEAGQPIGLRGINMDITERKRLEEEHIDLIAELDFEKARLQHIVDNSPSFIVSLRGPNFVFEMANPAYYQMVGQRALIGVPAREALPEVMSQGLPEMIRRVYNTGEPFVGNEVPVKLQPPNKSEPEQHYVNFVYLPLREADDSISGIVSYGMDVTEQVLSRTRIQESEERYRFLFDNNPLPMWAFDMETLEFLAVNEAAVDHYGYSREEFLSMTLQDLRLPEDVPLFLENVSKDIPGIENRGIHRHRIKNGTIIYVEIVSKQLIFEGRRAKLALASDVTERLKAEESVRFQAQLLDTVEQAVTATDLDKNVIYWNKFAEKLYGWTAEEAIGRSIREVTMPETGGEQAKQITDLLNEGKSWTGEFLLRNKNGTNFPAQLNSSPIHDSKGKLIGVVGVSTDITERKQAEEALRAAESQYRSLVESSPGIVYLMSPFPPYAPLYVSPNITRFGYTAEEWFDQANAWVIVIYEEDKARVARVLKDTVEREDEFDIDYRIIKRDGTLCWIHDNGRFVFDNHGNRTGWQGVMVDITRTKELEEQLRQSQKLESVGRLAGGIAHDFNNMLTAINGYSDLTLRKLDADSPLRRNVEEIKKAGERSAQLPHQLLAFSRQQVLQPIVLDLNEVIGDTTKLLERLIGEDVELVTALNSKTGRVNVDPGQLSQIIVNLAVNARDAMPHGGKLTIETFNVFLKPSDVKQKIGVLPGAYVMLAVCDTGKGIDESIQPHIFEPFFTTKEIGKGTGLGLATVYGIVKQSGGNIEVESSKKTGTTFRVFLPRVAEEVAAEPEDFFAEESSGSETILLVEDEELVRNLSREMLESSGYTVIEAGDGLEALEICKDERVKFDLLMTDVVMPQMGGRELAEKITEKMPDIKILFTSGYTDDSVVRHGVIETNTNFLQKPFTFDGLTRKVRELLDE